MMCFKKAWGLNNGGKGVSRKTKKRGGKRGGENRTRALFSSTSKGVGRVEAPRGDGIFRGIKKTLRNERRGGTGKHRTPGEIARKRKG